MTASVDIIKDIQSLGDQRAGIAQRVIKHVRRPAGCDAGRQRTGKLAGRHVPGDALEKLMAVIGIQHDDADDAPRRTQ